MKITVIKGIKIYKWGDIESELSPTKFKDFNSWMRGQTCLAEGVYVWDYNRWSSGLTPFW